MVSRVFVAEPTEAWQGVMAALDRWLHEGRPEGETWDEAEALVGAGLRAVRFGDATCDRCDRAPGGELAPLNYPVEVEATDSPGWWMVRYVCRRCGHRYRCGWSDDLTGID